MKHHRFWFTVFLLCCISFVPSNAEEETLQCKKVDDGVECDGDLYVLHEGSLPLGQFFIYIFICIFCVCFAGLMSGLTLGLLSLDQMNLQILRNSGTPTQKKYAERILPVVKKHHVLLVTLLLANAAAMEALPIFLDRITSPVLAIVISVTAVLFFGEVIPQALCSRYGLAIGAHTAWLVKILMWIAFPVAWPVGKLLDKLLGHENGTIYRRAELKELVSIHGGAAALSVDECTIIRGALDMKSKTVRECMTPLKSVYMLEKDSVLNADLILNILQEGHSRVPIYSDDKQNIIGLLLVKNLIGIDIEGGKKIADIALRTLPSVKANTQLYDIMNEFQTGKSHMAMVQDGREVVGIVTLEDIFEELIQEEILDESDLDPELEKRVKMSKMKNAKPQNEAASPLLGLHREEV